VIPLAIAAGFDVARIKVAVTLAESYVERLIRSIRRCLTP
jgi:hypothetical protein